MIIESINIKSWRQFNEVNINFHPRLTILTGANGAGKTTILDLLSKHFGWESNLVSVPLLNNGAYKYQNGSTDNDIVTRESLPGFMFGPSNRIGTIKYFNNNLLSHITIPNSVHSVYTVQIHNMQPIKGFNISSHRPRYSYSPVNTMPTKVLEQELIFRNYRDNQIARITHGHRDKTDTYNIKEALISLAVLGFPNGVIQENKRAIELYEGFIKVLNKVLPPKIGFKGIEIRNAEVVFLTESGEFVLDSVSGGIAAIIDLAWQIYMFDNKRPFVVIIDEPENHLHPEMQKTLLPNFLHAFPNVQFIIASHNPFIISSVKDSTVYAFRYNEENKVYAELLDSADKSGTANEILREVLGIESTTPDWINNNITSLIEKYKDTIHPQSIETFKSDLREAGLEKFITQSVFDLISRSKND